MAETPSGIRLRRSATLDVPGETRRQANVFLIWLLCLGIAVATVILRRPDPAAGLREGTVYDEAVQRWKRERVLVAGLLGLVLPGLASWWITHRRRRGGPHARGIVIDITDGGELRIWGRGHGQRVALPNAEWGERLVDVYTGRMGAWRQRRLRVRATQAEPGMGYGELQLATLAAEADDALELRLEGGEGDCVEVSREDYLAILNLGKQISADRDASGPVSADAADA